MKHTLPLIFSFLLTSVSWGQSSLVLRRDTSVRLETCSHTSFSRNLPLTTRYIQGIADQIIKSNPEVFSGDLAPQKICVGPDLTNSERAWAHSDSRSFFIETGIILRTQNQDQLAYVIGHELAHIALRHTPLDGNPVPLQEQAHASSLLREQKDNLKQLTDFDKTGNLQELQHLHDESRRLFNQLNDLFLKYFDEEFTANWMENEADETGSFYAMKAGFNVIEVGWRVEQLAIAAKAAGLNARTQNTGNNFDPHAPAPQISSSSRVSQASRACDLQNPEAPPRGIQRYALPCWQLWNLKVNLPRTESSYGALFNSPIPAPSISLPNLADVKLEISRALESAQANGPIKK